MTVDENGGIWEVVVVIDDVSEISLKSQRLFQEDQAIDARVTQTIASLPWFLGTVRAWYGFGSSNMYLATSQLSNPESA